MSSGWQRLVALTLNAGVLCASTRTLASLTYSNPFHPEQCELAIAAAERAAAQDAQAEALLAEGLLCRGLAQDDPWALEAAIQGFERIVAADGRAFFAQLYLAEALRRRFPLSDGPVTAFERALAALARADVGAARADLETHIQDSLRAIHADQRQFLPLLDQRMTEAAANTLPPERVGELVTLLAQTGPSGVERALATLDAYLAQHYDPALHTFYRAELLRGRQSPAAVAAQYRAAATALCEGAVAEAVSECSRARWRLEQVEPLVSAQQGGIP